MNIVFFVLPVLGFASFIYCMVLLMGFCLQAAPEPTPAVPVPDVAAVITVDEQALGGGPGLAHQVHLPEGSMMTDFVALFEGLSLAPATSTVVQGGDASVDGDASAGGEATVGGNATVGGDATVPDQDMPDLPPPGPPATATGLPAKARPPVRRPPVAPPWRFLRSEASEDTSVVEPVRKQPRQNKQLEPVPPDHPPPGLASDSDPSAPSAPHGSDTFVSPTSKAPAPPPATPAAPAAAPAAPAAAPAAPAAEPAAPPAAPAAPVAAPAAPAAASSSAEPAPEPAGPDVPLEPGTTAPRADVTADRWLSRARLEGRHLIVHHDDQSPQFDWEDPVMCLARNSLDVVIAAYDESMFGLHVSWTKGRDSSRLSHIACHTT